MEHFGGTEQPRADRGDRDAAIAEANLMRNLQERYPDMQQGVVAETYQETKRLFPENQGDLDFLEKHTMSALDAKKDKDDLQQMHRNRLN